MYDPKEMQSIRTQIILNNGTAICHPSKVFVGFFVSCSCIKYMKRKILDCLVKYTIYTLVINSSVKI